MNARFDVSVALAIAITATACATAPGPQAATSSGSTCHSLAIEIAQAETDRRTALAEGRDAWKRVIPLAVAMQYSNAQAKADDAGHRIQDGRARASAMGCPA